MRGRSTSFVRRGACQTARDRRRCSSSLPAARMAATSPWTRGAVQVCPPCMMRPVSGSITAASPVASARAASGQTITGKARLIELRKMRWSPCVNAEGAYGASRDWRLATDDAQQRVLAHW